MLLEQFCLDTKRIHAPSAKGCEDVALKCSPDRLVIPLPLQRAVCPPHSLGASHTSGWRESVHSTSRTKPGIRTLVFPVSSRGSSPVDLRICELALMEESDRVWRVLNCASRHVIRSFHARSLQTFFLVLAHKSMVVQYVSYIRESCFCIVVCPLYSLFPPK